MSRGLSPEELNAKLNQLEGSDDEKAILLIQEFIKTTKKRAWSNSMNSLIKKCLEIIIDQSQIKPFKEVLTFCRSLTQTNYLESLEHIVSNAKEFLLDKYEINTEKFKKFKDQQNILLDEENEINEENIVSGKDIIDEQQLMNEQKFIWEAYKTLLDMTKMNSRLFQLYNQILKDCFSFCGENKRIHEFKALCDSIRNNLFMLKKNENKPNFANKIVLSDPKILRVLIQTSLNQIETANKLEEWEESFKTSEKIIDFIEDYQKIEKVKEKVGKDGKKEKEKEKKYLKIPPLFEIELYNHIQKLLFVSNYPLYHSYAMISIKNTIDNNKNKLDNLTEKEKQIYDKYNLDKLNERILLSFLSTPIKNAYTNFTKIGEELYEDSNDTEIRTCQKMMKILKLNHIPSRKYLLSYLLNKKIVQSASSDIRELFDIFENETNPISLAKIAVKYIKKISEEELYKQYIKKIEENLVIRVLMLMPTIYKNISISRVVGLFKDLNMGEFEINDIISESSRINLFKCKIDLRNDLIKFVTNESSQNRFNNLLENFLKASKKAIKEIIRNKNKAKIDIIKEKIYKEMGSINSNSLLNTNLLLEETKKQNKKLKTYISKRDKLKIELKLKTAETKEKTIRLLQEKEQLERDELRDLQKKKEYEAEVKRRVIDLLRKYTNSIVLKDGKRVKLDDLLKDLSKISEEDMIKQLTQQEIESASKKEKELKKDTKRKDYILREFRKRDMELYEQESKKDLEILNKKRDEEIKKELTMRDEVLKYKSYKDSYCAEIEQKNLDNYKKDIEDYNKYLKEKVSQDIYKELDAFFDVYIEDFEKKQMEENQQKKAFDTWMPEREPKGYNNSYNYNSYERKPDKGFIRSQLADQNKEADDLKKKETHEFKRGQKYEEEKKKKEKETKEDKKNKKDKKGGDIIRKGVNDTEVKKDDKKKEDKKDESKKEDNWKGKKDKKDKKDDWKRGDDTKKEDKKDYWRRGGEDKKEEKKDDWRRGGEDKKEEKKDNWRRGGEDTKKDDWRRGGEDKKEEKKDNWRRGGEDKKEDNWRRGAEDTKKETKKESKKEENWRRGGDEPKKEDKKDDWRRGGEEPKKEDKKKDTKKEENWRRGGDDTKKEEPKKQETKKEENWRRGTDDTKKQEPKKEEPKKKKAKKKK